MSKVATADIKILNKFINEPNEFKRFILCQLWITQLYNETINKNIIKRAETIQTTADIYNMFRDLKQAIEAENEKLNAAIGTIQTQANIIKAINAVFTLNADDEVNKYNQQLKELTDHIKTNNDYIDKINNLSETQINNIINDTTQTNNNI